MNTPDLPPPYLPPVVLIAGPTASGKSALAMALAAAVPATIVNADSMQVYRDLRTLTARPSIEDERRVPHRLFGYIDGADSCSAARWAADARVAIADAHDEGRVPIVVGGTGLYIRALLDGLAPIPPIDDDIRAAIRAMPVGTAAAALAFEDPASAARLSPADTTRVARALEVVRSTGRSITSWQQAREGGVGDAIALHALVLLPPRAELQARIDGRFAAMFDLAHAEVAALVARRLDPARPVMRAIGVRQLTDHLAGRIGREDALAGGRLATRQYAKRQETWFRRQARAEWPIVEGLLNLSRTAALVTKLQSQLLT